MARRFALDKLAGAAVLFVLLRASAFAFQAGRSYSLSEADKVLKAIEKIKAENAAGGRPANEQNVMLSENELNAYIAYRIETEREDVLKELRLKIFDRNRLEGKIVIDLSGRKTPSFIKPRMTILFAADLVVGGGKGRLNVKELFLEDQKIQPGILGGILLLAATAAGLEPVGLEDWFDLPYGVKDIKTQKGFGFFYY